MDPLGEDPLLLLVPILPSGLAFLPVVWGRPQVPLGVMSVEREGLSRKEGKIKSSQILPYRTGHSGAQGLASALSVQEF